VVHDIGSWVEFNVELVSIEADSIDTQPFLVSGYGTVIEDSMSPDAYFAQVNFALNPEAIDAFQYYTTHFNAASNLSGAVIRSLRKDKVEDMAQHEFSRERDFIVNLLKRECSYSRRRDNPLCFDVANPYIEGARKALSDAITQYGANISESKGMYQEHHKGRTHDPETEKILQIKGKKCSLPECSVTVGLLNCICGFVSYCGKEHQKIHWPTHKAEHAVHMKEKEKAKNV